MSNWIWVVDVEKVLVKIEIKAYGGQPLGVKIAAKVGEFGGNSQGSYSGEPAL